MGRGEGEAGPYQAQSQAITPLRPSFPPEPPKKYRRSYSTRPLVVHHARNWKWRSLLMRPCDRGVDQLAAFRKLVQREVQFAQILTTESTVTRRFVRCGRRRFRHFWRLD